MLLVTIPLGSEKEEPEVAEKHGDSDEYVSFQYHIILKQSVTFSLIDCKISTVNSEIQYHKS